MLSPIKSSRTRRIHDRFHSSGTVLNFSETVGEQIWRVETEREIGQGRETGLEYGDLENHLKNSDKIATTHDLLWWRMASEAKGCRFDPRRV
jgi:hypothetical protein